MIKAYSEWKVPTLSEYGFIFVLLCMIQKLCVSKKWTPSGLSIEILRYIFSNNSQKKKIFNFFLKSKFKPFKNEFLFLKEGLSNRSHVQGQVHRNLRVPFPARQSRQVLPTNLQRLRHGRHGLRRVRRVSAQHFVDKAGSSRAEASERFCRVRPGQERICWAARNGAVYRGLVWADGGGGQQRWVIEKFAIEN